MNKIEPKTLLHLEWERLLDALARHASTSMGRERALNLEFLGHIEAVRYRYLLVGQAMGLLVRNINPSFLGAPSVGEYLVRAAKGGALEPDHLIRVGQLIAGASSLRKFHNLHRELAPDLWEVAREIVEIPRLQREIELTFDTGGDIKDSASDELKHLRRRVRSLQEELKDRLQDLMVSPDVVKHLQESYYTLREDRYVLPVKASDRGRVPGIVHGVSSSGATVFVEPQVLVELNNTLRLCQFQVEEEERRILARLTAMVVDQIDSITLADQVITDLDLVYAIAQLSLELGAHIPQVSSGGEMDLMSARHPYLILGGVSPVVPNHIRISGPARVMIISGANTGGKTVTLKTVGLFALMVRAGLPVTAAPDSVFPFFNQVFADVGDEQSISQSLSTFSGHLKSITSFLPRAGEGTLVLLDELVVGTDPEEGSALAQAILEYLAETGSTVVVTTHYERLKTLAYTSDRFSNASVGFNPDTLSPTFLLELGIPGSSSPISMGKRFGLLPQIIDRAARLVSGDTVRIEKLVAAMGEDRERMRAQEQEAAETAAAARKALAEAKAKQDAYERRRQELVDRTGEEVLAELGKAREQARAMVRELQRRSRAENFGFEDAEDARQRVLALNREVEDLLERDRNRDRGSRLSREAGGTHGGGLWGTARSGSGEQTGQGGGEAVEVGSPVIVGSMGCVRGTVLELEADRGRAVVLVGSMKVTVGVDDLYPIEGGGPSPGKKAGGAGGKPGGKQGAGAGEGEGEGRRNRTPASRTTGAGEPYPESRYQEAVFQLKENTLDLRGARVEEALESVERFLDRSVRESMAGGVVIIHGHGTGALKRAVRTQLRQSPYVAQWRPGKREEGGDGVSIAYLDL